MKRNAERGFTVIEVMVAVIVLTIGVLGLVGSAALVTRMIGRGNRAAKASIMAQQRIEILRGTRCASLASGADTVRQYVRTWTVTPVGNARRIQVRVRYPTTATQTRTDTTVTTIDCTP